MPSHLSDTSQERLGQLAALLTQFAKKGPNNLGLVRQDIDFDMGTFGCGTSACAAGLATLHPWFRRRGLTFGCNKAIVTADSSNSIEETRWPRYRDYSGFVALERFFDLTQSEVAYLFSPDSYPRTHHEAPYVARRIATFANTGRLPARYRHLL